MSKSTFAAFVPFACFDDAAPQPAPESTSDTTQVPTDGPKTFTQDQVNKFLADDRRKHSDKYTSLEQSYQDLLNNQSVVGEERSQLEDQLKNLQAQFRTKEQQAQFEAQETKTSYERQIEQLQNDKKVWEDRYTDSSISNSLQSAAMEHDAFNPNQIITQLRSNTRLVEEMGDNNQPTGRLVPMVEMKVLTDGAAETLQMTPNEAVAYMKKSPEQWGNFFKNNIREGMGSLSATDGSIGDGGAVDHSKMTTEQYMKLRKSNPSALGLDPNRRTF